MGGSSSGGGSTGGGGGGGDNKATPKAKKKAAPKAKKKSNGSSKYFKSTSTPKAKDTGAGRGDQSYAKQQREAAPAPKAKQPNQNNRANLPSTLARPVTPTKSVAKTSPAPAAVIKKNDTPTQAPVIKKPVAKKEALSIAPSSEPAGHPSANKTAATAIKAKSTTPDSKIKTTMGKETDGYGVNRAVSEGSAYKDTPKTAPVIATPKPAGDPRGESTLNQSTSSPMAAKTKATPKGGKSFSETISVADPKARNTTLLQKFQEQNSKTPNGIDAAKYNEIAKSQKDGNALDVINPFRGIIKDKYRNDDTSYNQAYWAARRESGASQADMAKEQQSLGMKKSYSGDRVVTDEDISRGKYTLASLEKAGITPEVSTEKKGLLGETTVNTSKYDIGTGKPLTITDSSTSPVIGGTRFGKDKSVTYVDGVAVWTGKGTGDEQSFETAGKAALSDQAKIEPMDNLNTVTDIQDAIEKTTDKKELADLHRRLRALMRSNRTRTKFGGLRLGDAEVKATKLGTRI